MDIAEVSKASGLPPSTLRYYEEKGLIQSSGRNGLRRLFKSNVLQRLAIIALGRSAGFSLDEVGEVFTPTGPKIDRQKLNDKADELDKKIKQLTAVRNGLRHAAACPEKNHMQCPKSFRLLRVAGKGRSREDRKSN